MQRIRLVVVDVDGVLSLGEATPFDSTVLQRLAELNDRSHQDLAYPAVTLCTGRPVPYVEVLMQIIHAYYPAIYENGAGLYIPQSYGFRWHPSITPGILTWLTRFQQMLQAVLVDTEQAYFQPGKSASLSVFPRPGIPLRRIVSEVSRLAGDFSHEFSIEEAATCVNGIIQNIDKAEGVRWLSRDTGIPLGAMAAVGDSPGDMSFMRIAAWSGAPANAHASVKEIACYTSPHEDGLGLVDILAHLLRLKPGDDSEGIAE